MGLINTHNLTRKEAQKAMIDGYKISHRATRGDDHKNFYDFSEKDLKFYFNGPKKKSEAVMMCEDGYYLFEESKINPRLQNGEKIVPHQNLEDFMKIFKDMRTPSSIPCSPFLKTVSFKSEFDIALEKVKELYEIKEKDVIILEEKIHKKIEQIKILNARNEATKIKLDAAVEIFADAVTILRPFGGNDGYQKVNDFFNRHQFRFDILDPERIRVNRRNAVKGDVGHDAKN